MFKLQPDSVRQGEALYRLSENKDWKTLLRDCGLLSDKLDKDRIFYEDRIRKYQLDKLYFEFALSAAREGK